MKVSDLVKKLTVITKFNETDDHLNAHAQRTGGSSRKKQVDSIVSGNAVHDNSVVKKCNICGIDFVSDKTIYKWCNSCHRSKFQDKLELTDGALQKFTEKKRHKQRKQFAKEKAGKSKKDTTQSQKKISANVGTTVSDSEDEQS
jgi:Zn-finger nucleic acid-binding protein